MFAGSEFLIFLTLFLVGEQGSHIIRFMCNPLSWVIEVAAIMALVLANGGASILLFSTKERWNYMVLTLCFFRVKVRTDGSCYIGIVFLLIINSMISFIEENNADNIAASLMARLAPKTKVFRSSIKVDGYVGLV